MRTQRLTIATVLAMALGLAACGGDDPEPAADGEVSGEITVLTNRTDIVDTVFADYKEQFESEYPDVTVNFEAITDYEGEVRIRMSTEDYGDVLLIPNSITPDQLPSFFEPLGSTEEMAQDYLFVNEQAYEGQTYGQAITGNAQGLVYNKAVWEEAGVTELPTTPEEFQAGLQQIADETEAIPLYTNYADGWPMTAWEGARGVTEANPEAVLELASDPEPWGEGKEHAMIDSMLFDAAAAELIEPDPATTNWEESKGMLGRGEIATMALASWAIIQMEEAADDPEDIGFMPWPFQVDGTFHSVIGGDYKNAVNVNSDSKAAALAWVEWFADESNYATDQGGVSPQVDAELPETLADFEEAGVEYLELTPATGDEVGLVDRIDGTAEIGLLEPDYRQRLIDAARGATDETKEDIFADLNERWAAAIETETAR